MEKCVARVSHDVNISGDKIGKPIEGCRLAFARLGSPPDKI